LIVVNFNPRKKKTAHRLSWELHNGQIPEGMCVLHKCDIRNCVNPDHLFLGTYADNNKDMRDKGRGSPPPTFYGEEHPQSKLTEELVRNIRTDERSAYALSKIYGVSKQTILRARNGVTWRHVK
jgi:hypothetical protein